MGIRIRKRNIEDVYGVHNILRINDQISSRSVGHPQALRRIVRTKNAIFLVAEVDNKIVGMVRGVWDSSRALIHQISVHTEYQRIGIGTALVKEIGIKFKDLGAPTVAVTASDRSSAFFEKLGFNIVPIVRFILNEGIDKTIKI